MTAPRVSVLLPVHDGARYLGTALASLAAQSFTDFEVLVVDDGSTDTSRDIVAAFAARDPRFRLLAQPRGGISRALMHGLAHARGALIARQDHDDVSWPERFARQVRALDAQPRLAALGTWTRLVDARGAIIGAWRTPVTPAEVRAAALAECPLAHPTAMMRREALEHVGGYRSLYDGAEDYDLWLRMLEHADLANLPEPLLDFRRYADSTSQRLDYVQAIKAFMARAAALARRAGLPDPKAALAELDLASLAAVDLPPPLQAEWLASCALGLARGRGGPEVLAWIDGAADARHRDDPTGRATTSLVRARYERAHQAVAARRFDTAAREIGRAFRLDARIALEVMARFVARTGTRRLAAVLHAARRP